MVHPVSSLWHSSPSNIKMKTETLIDSVRRIKGESNRFVFFRADDIAAPGKNFARLMDLFLRYRAPLSLAVVPAWLTGSRWRHLRSMGNKDTSLWCWHQHGWLHKNHELQGKKQEFGESRSRSQIRKDLTHGRNRLEKYLGKDFFPVFTPPWNRCGKETLELLKTLGFLAVSRSIGAQPPTLKELPDCQVNVDLHSRKEPDPEESWNNLFQEFNHALKTGLCGIMIHHRRMNDAAFDFLEILLQAFSYQKRINLVHLSDLVALEKANSRPKP